MEQPVPYSNFEDPITEMRQMSAIETSFRLEFRTKKDGTKRIIKKCILRKQSIGAKDSNSRYKLQFIDLDNDTSKSCYIPLLLSVNERKIILK